MPYRIQYPMRAADAANPGGWVAGGWLSMAKIVRDYDEEKVKDCKEDIDTLLVFVSQTTITPTHMTISNKLAGWPLFGGTFGFYHRVIQKPSTTS